MLRENDFPTAMSPVLPAGTCVEGRYLIEAPLAEGGMARVYVGRKIETSEKVAVKQILLPPDKDHSAWIERFRREYHFLNAIDHPNLVKALDFFSRPDGCLLVLEFVAGVSLQRLLEQPKSLSFVEQLAAANQMARAVDALNTAGIVHRDLKPGNVMLDSTSGKVTVLDLGIGKAAGKAVRDLTEEGEVVGTWEYLSPEQIAGEISLRSDVFSLGVCLYQFFLWERISPFQKTHAIATLMAIATDSLPPLSERLEQKRTAGEIDLDRRDFEACRVLSKILDQAMEKEPEKRPSAREIADAVDDIHRKAAALPDRTSSRSPWNVSRRLGGQERARLEDLGHRYGREEAGLRSEIRIAKRKKTRPGIRFAGAPRIVLPLALSLAALCFFVEGATLRGELERTRNQTRDLERRLEEIQVLVGRIDGEKEDLLRRIEESLSRSEREHSCLRELHEGILLLVPYEHWGQFYERCADYHEKLLRREEAVESYRKAATHTLDARTKVEYMKKIELLERR